MCTQHPALCCMHGRRLFLEVLISGYFLINVFLGGCSKVISSLLPAPRFLSTHCGVPVQNNQPTIIVSHNTRRNSTVLKNADHLHCWLYESLGTARIQYSLCSPLSLSSTCLSVCGVRLRIHGSVDVRVQSPPSSRGSICRLLGGVQRAGAWCPQVKRRENTDSNLHVY